MERKMMKIRVEIAEKPYRITIPIEDEERVRRAASHIKEQIETLKRKHEATLTEYLAMAALQISIENQENREKLETSPATLRLRALSSQLEEWADQQEEPKTPAPQNRPETAPRKGATRKSK